MSEERVPLSQADGAQTPQEPKKVTSETYKCLSCGNFLKFDPATQKLKCAYCGTERDIAAKPAQELVYTTLSEREFEAWGGTKAYKCPSCGAVAVLEEYETADVCPFCGAPNIIERDELPGLKPNAVLPFKVPEDEAKGFWRKWLKKKWLAPGKLKKEARMQKMRGVYIPVWTFDSHVDAMYEARLGETYTVIVGTGKNRRTETRVRWFHVSGVINQDYDDIQVEASKHIDGKALGKLGGFDTVNALAYDDDFMSGYSAERYSDGLDDCWDTAQGIIIDDLRARVKARYPRADRVDYINISPVYSGTTYKYVCAPLWISSYRYRKKDYGCVVNGRTGKAYGKAPVSPIKATLLGLAIAAVVAGIAYLFVTYLL